VLLVRELDCHLFLLVLELIQTIWPSFALLSTMLSGLVCNKEQMTSVIVVMLCYYWILAPHLQTWLKPAVKTKLG
jgi:hypothetical protein